MPARGARGKGALGEELACRHLERAGYRIVARNVTTKAGEIDIVCRDGPTLVIVEVKLRSGPAFGTPEEAVDRRKQAHLSSAASLYAQSNGYAGPIRFDVVAVDASTHPPGIRLIRDAFQAE